MTEQPLVTHQTNLNLFEEPTMPNPIVDITDVFSAAESVPIETVKVGDRVFSVTGETSPVTRVQIGRAHV